MASRSDLAVETALKRGAALLKFVSPNDCGLTMSHQRGFYLPKHAWRIFCNVEPVRGENRDEDVLITWHDGTQTSSKIKWYGLAKNEYRLTGFGRNFPFLRAEQVGSLLVFIPQDNGSAECFLLDTEEDIENTQVALGVDASVVRWGIYDPEGYTSNPADRVTCIDRRFAEYVAGVDSFPATTEVSNETLSAISACSTRTVASYDHQLEQAIRYEYQLFKNLEEKFVGATVREGFADVESFLTVAQSVLQRRKSRAGRSLEFHVERILEGANIPFQSQANLDGTRPDLVIPNARAYYDGLHPQQPLFIVGLKTTCKDRWRQVLQEAPRVAKKYLLTLQPGISANQIRQMSDENVQLVVPAGLHDYYEPSQRRFLLDVDSFLNHVRKSIMGEDYEAASMAIP